AGNTATRDQIDVLQGDQPAWADQGDHLGDDALRVGLLEDHQAFVGQVEAGAWQPSFVGVPVLQLDVAQAALSDDRLAHRDEARLPLEPDDRPFGPHPRAQQVEDAEQAAANVDDAPAALDTQPIHEPAGLRRETLALLDQAFLLGEGAAQDIVERTR